MAAVALLATACGTGGGATLSEGAAASSTTAAVPTATEVTAGVTTTLRPPARVTTTAPATAATTAAPAAVGRQPAAIPLAPPAPGTYRYDTRGRSTFGAAVVPFPAVTTLVVDPAAGTRQRAVRDLRDAGTGLVLEYVLDYRSDGVYLVSLGATISALLFTQREDLRPPSPVLLLPTGAGVGSRRQLDVPSAAGGTAHLVVEVQGPATINAGGGRIDTTAFRLTATLAGQLDNRIELTVWVADATRVWAQERLVAEATGPGGEAAFRSEYTATLVP
ncbi:MAG: hypothetical protein ACLGI2_15995 [Acidimicrobiia bacterium]